MSDAWIDGVVLTPLKVIRDDRGSVMHMLRHDSPMFEVFGEIYFSTINPATVKAWKRHREMTLNLAVPAGAVRFVLFDDRPGSATVGQINEFLLGGANYALLTIPPGVWNGFANIGDTVSVIANMATQAHDTDEVDRLSTDDASIPFLW